MMNFGLITRIFIKICQYSICCFAILSVLSYLGVCEASITHCKGIKLCGKVKVVKHFADLKVQVVKNFPDLKVKRVKHFPKDIGEWQFLFSSGVTAPIWKIRISSGCRESFGMSI